MSDDDHKITRRDVLANGARCIGLLVLGGSVGALAMSSNVGRSVWQLDPRKCIHCGRCATNCVLKPSAVKCVNVLSLCINCELCGGFLRIRRKERVDDPQNRRCPHGAIIRTPIEGLRGQYTIDADRCTGCAKCTVGCVGYGAGSMMLQVDQQLCVGCNNCSIASACPADAFVRVPAAEPYILKAGNRGT